VTSSPLLSCHSGSATAEIWRHIDFSRWRLQSLNTTSGFVFVDVLAFRRSKSVNKPNFVDISNQHISIYGWDITTSVFEKQKSAILEFNFRFWSWPLPIMCMSFYITLPNFVQIGAPTAEIWRHFHFSKWRPRPLNTSAAFHHLVLHSAGGLHIFHHASRPAVDTVAGM